MNNIYQRQIRLWKRKGIRHAIRGEVIKGEADLDDKASITTWPSVGCGIMEAKSTLYSQMEVELNRKMESLHRRTNRNIENREECVVYLDVLDTYISRSTIYEPILRKIADSCRAVLSDFSSLSEKFDQMLRRQTTMESAYTKVVNTAKQTFCEKSHGYQEVISEYKRDVKRFQDVTSELEEEIKEQNLQLQQAKQKSEEQEKSYQLLTDKFTEQRENLRDLRSKTASLMKECSVLNHVALFNGDLLNEINELKANLIIAQKARDDTERHSSSQHNSLIEKSHNARDLIKSLNRVARMHTQEIEKLEGSVTHLNTELVVVTKQRDSLLQSHTPRPSFDSIESKLGLDLKEKTTADRATVLSDSLSSLVNQTCELQKRVTSAENVLSFLKQEENGLPMSFEQPLQTGRMFVGQGTHVGVPQFLRYYGSVRSRNFTIVETRQLITDFLLWVTKLNPLQTTDNDITTLPTDQSSELLFSQWLQSRGQEPQVMFEFSYSLLDVCRQAFIEYDLHYFDRCLFEEGNLRVLGSLLTYCDSLKGTFINIDTRYNHTTGRYGILKKKLVFDIVLQGCKLKSDNELLRVKHALQRDSQNRNSIKDLQKDEYHWGSLFTVDDRGKSSLTLSVLREQFIVDHDELRVDCEQLIAATAIEGNFGKHNNEKFTSHSLLIRCLQCVDPHQSLVEVQSQVEIFLSSNSNNIPVLVDGILSSFKGKFYLRRASKKHADGKLKVNISQCATEMDSLRELLSLHVGVV